MFQKSDTSDIHGHGTHCAGIIGGKRFGVAKDCTLISVKIMNDTGACAQSELISALISIFLDVFSRRLGSFSQPFLGVVNLSLGSPRSIIVDIIVEEVLKIGLHVVTAACNHDNDAMYYSPAGVESVITVGASTFTDSRAWFSNKGSTVDIYAPGVFITSATYNPNHPNDTELKSGTSSACAHVSGLVAYLLGLGGYRSPEEMKKDIIELSIKDTLTDIPIGSNNRLANFAKLKA
ncbi:peptidase S8/S53 domain-containing protein [Gymnopilus junonius]|uniref:Peptidase S8/S53 domain-containing protein n=1 Tax=Gymnopilus junonius TaxID=109634 RepID=A0A9P5NQ95_GYMJU|nr:peptidase S8/S53 domain-containing protein [Gymnopilus junonius]